MGLVPERTVWKATTAMWYRPRGAEGPYAETPKASTFQASKAPKRDAEGVERLHLGICGDVMVNSRQLSFLLHYCSAQDVCSPNNRPTSLVHSRQRHTYFTDGNLHVLATWIRTCSVTPTGVSVCLDTCHSLRAIVYKSPAAEMKHKSQDTGGLRCE